MERIQDPETSTLADVATQYPSDGFPLKPSKTSTIKPALPSKPQIEGRPGAPSKLTPETREACISLAEVGVGERTIADFVGVNYATLHRWKQRDPSFKQEMAQARATIAANVHLRLLEAVKRGNIRGIELWLRLRTPEDFRDSKRVIDGKLPVGEAPKTEFLVLQGDGRPAETVVLSTLQEQGYTIIAPDKPDRPSENG